MEVGGINQFLQGRNKTIKQTKRDNLISPVLSTGLTWKPVGQVDSRSEICDPKAHHTTTAECTHERERLRKCMVAQDAGYGKSVAIIYQ